MPVIASNRGGLPECVPNEHVIDDYHNIDVWVSKIKEVLHQKKPSKMPIDTFYCNNQIDVFLDILKKYE